MTDTAKLLDDAQSRMGLKSDNSLAKALGWRQSTIAGYRTGRSSMDVEKALDFAKKTGIELELVVRAAVTDRKNKNRRTVARQHALPL